MHLSLQQKIILFSIILLAAIFRLTAINWDQGNHLHPDERAIVLSVVQLHFPTTFTDFFSIDSQWNPHFFAYGSFPIYLLRFIGDIGGFFVPSFAAYEGINLLGRIASALFDIGTIICLFFIGKKIKNITVGMLGSFFYSISVLPIQLSHFYAVDTLLTFFITATLLSLILFYEKPTFAKALLIGGCISFALATKISATVILISVFTALVADFGLLFMQHPLHPKHWVHHVPKFAFQLSKDLLIIVITTVAMYVLLEPYAVIDYANFWQQTQQQSAMTKDAFTFPYTLQYVGKIPYFYELKNIFFWGMGPLLATISFIGTIFVTYTSLIKHRQAEKWADELILISFFWSYFIIVGLFAIGFMRYMLPLYPLLCLFAAICTSYILAMKSNFKGTGHLWFVSLGFLFLICLFIWPINFMHIYSQPNTRVLATDYINTTIPIGATIAIEHWDDGLPLNTQPNYRVETLTMYDPDTTDKWQQIIRQLEQTQYVIIASNRLYVPIQKLANCNKYPPPHCYPIASMYYKNLFSGKPVLADTPFANYLDARTLRFRTINIFSISPQIPFVNIPINDQGADESFTVYDHPKIMIFKKIR